MSCKHLKKFKQAGNIESYRIVCNGLLYPKTEQEQKRKAVWSQCLRCRYVGPKLMCCLYCVYSACIKLDHMKEHQESKKHPLAVSMSHGQIYCSLCGDYVYDNEMEYIRRGAENANRRLLGLPPLISWTPTRSEVEALKKNPKRIKLTIDSTIGMRGLINLGNTCFMNCILQALTHTPLLRDYFMADRHRCHSASATDCLACELARVFQEFYSGTRKPHVPLRLLHMVWQHARHLAGYEQQDAHEFFIAALDVLHRHCKTINAKSVSNPNQCSCIIDQIFTGGLQSDVTCQSCKNISTTVDPYWDISLDISLATATQGGPGPVEGDKPLSLLDCLDRFTRSEHLGSMAKIKCNNCESYQESTKQLTLKKLPIVACFHLKRFQQWSRLHKKITSYISFPQYLNMSPFISGTRNGSLLMDDSEPKSTKDKLNRLRNRYTLFAVVNHVGSLDSGHYTCYVRQHRGEWYKCDDHVITKASLREVMSSEGYLLFYHKQFLDYE